MSKNDPVKLDPNEILTAEFEYIAQTAFQANEDRARVASFYVVSVGSFIAAILGTQYFNGQIASNLIYWAFSGLFLLLTIMGAFTIIQLARLRVAWYSSAEAMNQIKEYYITNLKDAKLEKALLWRANKLPSKTKDKSIARLLAIQVAVLSGVTFGTFGFFFLAGCNPDYMLSIGQAIFATVMGVLAYIIQMRLFTNNLNDKEKK